MIKDLPLSKFRPQPKLVVQQSGITRPCRPVIDGHNHLGAFGGHWDQRPAPDFCAHLDQAGVAHYVDLDGGWGEDILADRLRRYKSLAPDRYRTYGVFARFLESDDEYFNYGPNDVPGQGRWQIYGLNLPRPILDQIYYTNAARLFGLNDQT